MLHTILRQAFELLSNIYDFTELWATGFYPENSDMVVLVFVCFTSLKIVCPKSMFLSQQGIIVRVPISNISVLSIKRRLVG